MWCLRCGTRDPGSMEVCTKCSNELAPQDNKTGYFSQMMRLTGQLLNGTYTLEEYEKTIQWATEAMDDMSKGLEPMELQMKSMGLNEMAMNMMNRPLTSFKEGIKTFHEGLEQLRFYVYEQNQGHLRNGLMLLEKANNLFNYTADTANYIIKDIKKELTEDQIAQVEKEVNSKMKIKK